MKKYNEIDGLGYNPYFVKPTGGIAFEVIKGPRVGTRRKKQHVTVEKETTHSYVRREEQRIGMEKGTTHRHGSTRIKAHQDRQNAYQSHRVLSPKKLRFLGQSTMYRLATTPFRRPLIG